MSKWFDLGGFIGTVKDLQVSGQESGIWSLSSFFEVSAELKNYEGNYGTPDYTITSFPSTGTGLESAGKDGLIAIDLTFTTSSQGTLFEAGGTGRGTTIGIENGTLRARTFVGSDNFGSTGTTTAVIETDISAYAGSACTLYFKIDFSQRTLTAFVQPVGKGSTSEIIQLATNQTSGTSITGMYGGDTKGYGQIGNSVADINTGGTNFHANFNGTLTQLRYWADSTSFDVSDFGNNYTNS